MRRKRGTRVPLVTQDFGPSTVKEERSFDWPGGEFDILGKPIKKQLHENFHPALDISKGGCGGEILAAAPGKVTTSHKDGSGAEVIVIDHGKIDGHHYETRYVHLKIRLLEVKAPVEMGTVIGKLGGTGLKSTGCHLHFAITKDGKPVDPWRRLMQNATVDPDAPAATAPVATTPVVASPAEVPDVPIPASNEEYLAGQIAVIGNVSLGARVRTAAKESATLVRTIPAGAKETWLPTCFVVGEVAFGSDRWLTRWNNGQWEFTHKVNVDSVAPLTSVP